MRKSSISYVVLAAALLMTPLLMAAQHDYTIDDGPGLVVLGDMNDAYEAAATNNSGATAPAATYPNQWWFDTSTNLLKQRNNGNTEWVTVALKDGNGWTPYRQGTALGDVATLTKDTDGALTANSDTKVATQKATKTYSDGLISALNNTSTGQNHDGSGSRKIKYTNLDMTGITNGHYLYNNNGTPAGAVLSLGDAAAGDVLEASADTERTSTSNTYEKKKEIRLPRVAGAGTYRIKFDLKRSGDEAYAMVYRNGSPVGTERSGGVTYATFSEDISGWSAGDLCQLYVKKAGGATAYVQNFRIYVSNSSDYEVLTD